jgi:CysZ protein
MTAIAMNGNLFTGAGYFMRGVAMTFEPGLRRFVIVPLVANVILFSLMGWFAYEFISDIYDASMLSVPEWLQFLSWIITPVLWLLGGLMTGYLSTFLVLMLTSPFHALLAEKVEEAITGEPVPAVDGIAAALLEVPRALFREVRKILYYLPMALAVLILTLMPVLNAVAPVGWFLLGAWMMSLQFVDYPMDNHRLPFRDVRDACAARRLSTIGFGGAVAFFSGIPLLNLMVIPAAVIGATLLWCHELRPLR